MNEQFRESGHQVWRRGSDIDPFPFYPWLGARAQPEMRKLRMGLGLGASRSIESKDNVCREQGKWQDLERD